MARHDSKKPAVHKKERRGYISRTRDSIVVLKLDELRSQAPVE
jgi:hypothetical protein